MKVAIEAIERKLNDLVVELNREETDIVKLQLLLQGSISAQVNDNIISFLLSHLKGQSRYSGVC